MSSLSESPESSESSSSRSSRFTSSPPDLSRHLPSIRAVPSAPAAFPLAPSLGADLPADEASEDGARCRVGTAPTSLCAAHGEVHFTGAVVSANPARLQL